MLTHLNLRTDDNYTPEIHLGRVLDVCCNLVSLELSTCILQCLTVSYPKLIHLTLDVGVHSPLPFDTMVNIISYLPSLVFLGLFPIPDSRFLTAVGGHCPNLKIMHCSENVLFARDNYHRHVDGLQKLSFGLDYMKEPYNSDYLIHILLQRHQSLDYISVTGSITDSSGLLDGRHSILEFGRLKQLVVEARNEELVKLATFIISRAPHLYSINLGQHTTNHDHIYNALKRSTNLRVIEARKLPADAPSFHILIHHHVQLAMDSSLQELTIDFDVGGSHSPWVHAIAQLETLQHLVLRTWNINVPSTYLAIMGILAKGCPSLRSLDLDCWRCTIPEGSIAHLKHHPTLDRLRVHASSISDSDIISIVSFTTPRHLIINSTIKDYLLELVKKHITHVGQGRW